MPKPNQMELQLDILIPSILLAFLIMNNNISFADESSIEPRLPPASVWKKGQLVRDANGKIKLIEAETNEMEATTLGSHLDLKTFSNNKNARYNKKWQDPDEFPAGDYLADPIRLGKIVVGLSDFVQLPDTRSVGGSVNKRPARVSQMKPAPGSKGRLYVSDQRGKIYIIEDGVLLDVPFLDLTVARPNQFMDGPEGKGLNDFAFHPDFTRNGTPGFGLLFTTHTERPRSKPQHDNVPVFKSPIQRGAQGLAQDVVVSWKVSTGNPNLIDISSRRELLRVEHPAHHIRSLGFNPKALPSDDDYGNIYIGVGDIGYIREGENYLAQNRDLPHGKILRVIPLPHDERPYGIPKDNPFLKDEHTLPEIWALGLRNPVRISWDGGNTDLMFIADIGQAMIEEINLGYPGANYGWGLREGTFKRMSERRSAEDDWKLLPLPDDDESFGFTYPLAQYDHDEGRAIMGGYIYRGKEIPEIFGKYIFGDLVNGRLFAIDTEQITPGGQLPITEIQVMYQGQKTTLLELSPKKHRVDLRFGIDHNGELYVMSQQDAKIRRLIKPLIQ